VTPRTDPLENQPSQKSVLRHELSNCDLSRLACLFHRPAVSTVVSPSFRWFPSLAIDRRGRIERDAGIEYDAYLMPVRYQQRQEQPTPVRYLSARHRRCELRYSQEYSKTFKHGIVFYLDRAWGGGAE
jgi:hypothetical protein